MKTVLLWNPRVPVLAPVRLSLPDEVASALVRCGVAAAAEPADQGALQTGGALAWDSLIEVVVEDGPLRDIRRVLMPDAAVSIAASLGIAATVDGTSAGGVAPDQRPTPITPPALAANAIEGQTITEYLAGGYTIGVWSGADSVTFAVRINGEEQEVSYVLHAGDVIQIVETATNEHGSRPEPSNSVTAAAVAVTNTRIGMNMTVLPYYAVQRPFSNLLLGDAWVYQDGKLGPIDLSLISRAGDLIPGSPLLGNVQRGLFDVPGSGAYVVVFRCDGNSANAAGVTLSGSSISNIQSVQAHGDRWTREFTYTRSGWNSAISAWVVTNAATVGTNLPYDVFVCEKSLFDSYGGDVDEIPIWHPDYVSWLAGLGLDRARFLNWMATNFNAQYLIDWEDRSQSTLNAAPAKVDAYGVFPATNSVANQSLIFSAKNTFYNHGYDAGVVAYFGARFGAGTLPPYPSGPHGNAIAVTLNAASGGGNVVVVDDQDDEVHITITPPAGTTTAAGIRDWFNANATTVGDALIARRWIVAGGDFSSAWGGNNGTTEIGAHAKTFLTRGRAPCAADGVKLEWMLDLCEELGWQPWFTLPYQATTEYYQGFAGIVAARALRQPAKYEMGNELWNGGFFSQSYMAAKAIGNGVATGTQWGEDHVACMEAVRSGDPRALRVLATQHVNVSNAMTLLAVDGVVENTDIGATAPYFGDQTMPGSPPTDDVDVVLGRIEATIPGIVGYGVSNYNAYTNEGLSYETYEGGQTVVPGAPYQAAFEELQRSDGIRRLTNIFFSEWERRVSSLPDEPFVFNYYSLVTTIDARYSAFGAFEYQGQPLEEAPKAKAIFEARDGDFEPYLAIGESITLSTMAPRVGAEITATVPAAYNAASVALQWHNDVGAIEGATALTYEVQASDLGRGLYLTATPISATGKSCTYQSQSTAAVLPFVDVMVITLTNDTIVDGKITIRSGWTGGTVTAHCFGRGGLGVTVAGGGGSAYNNGGGGGAYAGKAITGLTDGQQIAVQIGNGANAVPTIFGANEVVADHGRNATNASGGGGAGGLAVNSVGDVVYDGGNGASRTATFQAGGGGGGAAGPDGPGGDAFVSGVATTGGGAANGGSDSTSGSYGGNGGANRLGLGAGQGGLPSAAAQAGQNGGGGGGGGGGSADPAGPGNQYGAPGGMDILFKDSVTGQEIGPCGGPGGSTSAVERAGVDAGYAAGAASSGNGAPAASGGGFIVLVREAA